MSTTTRNVITAVIGIVVGLLLLRWVFHVVLSLVWSLLPLALVVGGLYAAYRIFGPKSLGGGRRTLP